MNKDELTDMEIDICRVISKHTPWRLDQIEMVYKKTRSWDKTIMALEHANVFNADPMYLV
jgi:septum formation topological specificity factor MinE